MEGATQGIACCFDKKSQKKLKDFKKNGLSRASRTILEELTARDVKGMKSLELGSGVGALTISLLKAGEASATGIDLSPEMVGTAKALASEAGLSGSVVFTVGDGAHELLQMADIVILDSVLCCYPDTTALVENSSSASMKYYAISLPDGRRVATKLLRMFLPLQFVILRRKGFRFYLPDIGKIMKQLESKGFKPIFDASAGYVWSVVVFSAPSAS